MIIKGMDMAGKSKSKGNDRGLCASCRLKKFNERVDAITQTSEDGGYGFDYVEPEKVKEIARRLFDD